jgi:predicted acyl esterase
MLLLDAPRRLKYRDSFEKPSLLEPGKVYKVAFDIGYLSQVFMPGHRIRIAVSSTMADYFEPNPNTGAVPTYERPKEMRKARNVLHPGSRIVAPVK